MRRTSEIISGLGFFILIVLTGLAAEVRESAAQAICPLEFTKEAEGLPSGTDFIFDATITPSGITFAVHIPVDEINGVNIGQGDTLSLTESPQHGFVFDGVDCDAASSVVVTEFEDGFSVQCLESTSVVTSCVVRNVRRINPIPALSEWGLIAAAGGLLLVSVFYAMRRRAAKA
ncbi:MAG TPA: IPTL-CTERM sorting domain-containing protein [Thermodesulfobacteriota bacterium]|nr:IPTL-CTERM sorting domain-containing protein [Thermodesulfobacteriota bacterium]